MASLEAHNDDTLSTSVCITRSFEWAMKPNLQTDLVVAAGGINFALNKLPLVSRSGRIRKMLSSSKEHSLIQLDLSDIPGGAEAFELAAKFCYNVAFEMTTSNVAPLCCAAHYLEMTEEYSERNLISHCEKCLVEIVMQHPANAAVVLHSCESLLPDAEDLNIVSRCIHATSTACREQVLAANSQVGLKSFHHTEMTTNDSQQNVQHVKYWADDLSILRIDFYQRVLAAMKSQGLRDESIGGALMRYAYHSLKGLNRKLVGWEASKSSFKEPTTTPTEHEQRILVETIVTMLPSEKNSTSCSFLFGLLSTAVALDATLACRLELEQKIALQLEQATLDDLLIPSSSYVGDTLFQVDIIYRITKNFLEQKENDDVDDSKVSYDSDDVSLSYPNVIMKVTKLLDAYLGEIAPDTNLKLEKFISLASLLPDHARVVDDNLYKAIDAYLKTHPDLTEIDRRRLCKLMDVQKLSQEACSHAAQNERLPVQVVIQVLYFEQMRLRKAMAASFEEGEQMGYHSLKMNSGARSAAMSPRDMYSSIRRENRELRLEVARMKMRLTDLEKEQINMKRNVGRPGLMNGSKLFQSFSKTLSRLNPFHRSSSRHSKASSRHHHHHPHTPDSHRGGRHSIS
ncbi:hypothetical protein O6H91_16G069300 [Diphasiastrum complanatum]|uniref:Uncharacterized protein n=2 Tax=Diphasiastrum complanatum TaxID=34168 RepID=A0ACC2BDB1_DIPCM|nr:hypothetical protein O6H91_16G062100 [Diphasiastrum complanatum]KAJ7527746.1 hypothetical protein O6H91_16G069300 [Diphasiastrum complanatum]